MGDQDNTVVLGTGIGAGTGYISGGAGTDTITFDSSIWSNSSVTIPNGGYITSTGSTTVPYTITTTGTGTGWYQNPSVSIDTDGMKIKEGGDIKIGDKSLTKAIEQIEERLGILHPNPELEDRWTQLKELRQQYMELEKDLLEKEKLMKILKES